MFVVACSAILAKAVEPVVTDNTCRGGAQDMFTCLTSAVKPHHMTGSSGVVLGYSHFGMLAAARWILK
eukprot:scaffold649370_cov50-Prasinocladus_malaysianus.AAC.1